MRVRCNDERSTINVSTINVNRDLNGDDQRWRRSTATAKYTAKRLYLLDNKQVLGYGDSVGPYVLCASIFAVFVLELLRDI